jgi:hypothetical protein
MKEACCIPATPPSPAAACPTNQLVGRPVAALTLKSQLALPLTLVSPNQDYRFCSAPDCATVYYRSDGKQVFREGDLRERVYQKHRDSDAALVCYCFRHTVGDIRDEIGRTGASAILDNIRAGVRAGQCACDIRNPQGSCCLGNVLELFHDRTGKPRPKLARHG